MRKLNTEVNKNLQVIQSIIQTLTHTANAIDNTMFVVLIKIKQLKKRLAYQAKILFLFTEIELAMSLLDKQLIQLQEAIDIMATGYLSSMLIPPICSGQA